MTAEKQEFDPALALPVGTTVRFHDETWNHDYNGVEGTVFELDAYGILSVVKVINGEYQNLGKGVLIVVPSEFLTEISPR